MSGNKFRCEGCSKAFQSERDLQQHQTDTGHDKSTTGRASSRNASHGKAQGVLRRLTQPKGPIAAGVGALVLALGALGFAFLGGSESSSEPAELAPLGTKADLTAETVGTSVGKRAPEFSLTSIDGDAIPYDSDKPTVIFYMAAWCTECIPEERALATLHGRYGDQVQIISVDVDPQNDSAADTRRFQRQYGGPWPHALSGEMARLFRVSSLDTTLVLNRHNVITYRDEHPTDYETLRRQVRKVLPDNSS